jgi:hypothetical protein
MKIILDKVYRENESVHFMFSNFFGKLHRLGDNVEKYSGHRGATNDVTIWRIRVACSSSKAVHLCACTPTRPSTHSNNGFVNTP